MPTSACCPAGFSVLFACHKLQPACTRFSQIKPYGIMKTGFLSKFFISFSFKKVLTFYLQTDPNVIQTGRLTSFYKKAGAPAPAANHDLQIGTNINITPAS
jgi:hypothetical protein